MTEKHDFEIHDNKLKKKTWFWYNNDVTKIKDYNKWQIENWWSIIRIMGDRQPMKAIPLCMDFLVEIRGKNMMSVKVI